MAFDRRNFLKGAAGLGLAPLVGSFLLKNPTIVQGAVDESTGLVLPNNQEVLIATEMPVQREALSFSMYATRFQLFKGAPIEVTSFDDNRRVFVDGPLNMEMSGPVSQVTNIDAAMELYTQRRKLRITVTLDE